MTAPALPRTGWCHRLRAVIRPPLFHLHSLVCKCTLSRREVTR